MQTEKEIKIKCGWCLSEEHRGRECPNADPNFIYIPIGEDE